MKALQRLLILAVLVLIAPGQAFAHEVRPALLQITEDRAGAVDVLWKLPQSSGRAIALAPRISGYLLSPRTLTANSTESTFLIRQWHIQPSRGGGLVGRTVSISGLDRTITSVILKVQFADGSSLDEVLTAANPRMRLEERANGLALLAYLQLGIVHVLSGPDHLLFVLGLVLLAGINMRLLGTIFSFTVAHSAALGATALHLIVVDPALIEVLVALSIALLAVELVHAGNGMSGLTSNRPWLIAFCFGLLHGAAFAGALAQVGLNTEAILSSLLIFNLGVEAGQLIFIAPLLAMFRLTHYLPLAVTSSSRRWAPHMIGGVASFWFLDRLGDLIG